MSRLSAVCLAAALAIPASAQQPPPTTPPPVAPPAPSAPPAAPLTMVPTDPVPSLVLGRVVDGQFETTVVQYVPVRKTATVTEKTADGQLVQREVQFTELQAIQTRQQLSLKPATVTGADGRPIPADKLAELLKEESVVVVTHGAPAAEKYRKAFKDGTVFIAFPPPVMPVPAVMPAPVTPPKPVPASKKSEP